MVAEQIEQIYDNRGGKKRKMRGGEDKIFQEGGIGIVMRYDSGGALPGDLPVDLPGGQTGGAPTPLTPSSLSGVSFDQMGNQLANKAHNVYVQKNYELAALKNVNAMKGGAESAPFGTPNYGGRRSRRTAKKYSRSKSRNKRSNKRIGKRSNKRSGKRSNKRSNKRNAKRRGGGLVEAVVPLGLLAAQQTLFKKGSSKRYNKYGGQIRRL